MPSPGTVATVTSKGQVTLPKALRERLGLRRGSRIRFQLDERGGLRGDPLLHELEELWARADLAPRRKRAVTGEEMDAAKGRRRW